MRLFNRHRDDAFPVRAADEDSLREAMLVVIRWTQENIDQRNVLDYLEQLADEIHCEVTPE